MGKLYIVGIGPGSIENMTLRAVNTIKKSEIIIGYNKYLEMISQLIQGKEIFSTGMKGEIERCKKAIELSKSKIVSIVSTGDSGVYGMAGLILQLDKNTNVEIIPGVTASLSAASVVGAPLMHDNCSISLSNLMTPYELIKKRVKLAAEGDFVISLYNPKSNGRPDYLRECISIIENYRSSTTPVAVVKNALRQGQKTILTNIKDFSDEQVDMMSIVIIGNSKSYIDNDKFITPRGYETKIN
ncbi:precorrin-3B C(17)-methyltransferase [Clostridium tyrobutyricum]|uniref:precorrin-3B C(17)-methyltransferase n=1 Tax=Clostridium tyrobutyricum TaxID=1519 RepID=UPI001C395299|nr:precorrin-3B C(17)-methyltransferase [Clostridium tyrobutyricum]MBV4418202.1 precorrin-3B C(17)-methyltransferase [Clostridium tyrobutyricum]